MAGLPPDWLGALPLMCVHIIETHPRDISEVAIELVRTESVFIGDAETTKLVHEITATYGVAASRIANLLR